MQVTDLELLAIQACARGMVSGQLHEWPILVRALQKLDIKHNLSDSPLIYRTACQHALEINDSFNRQP